MAKTYLDIQNSAYTVGNIMDWTNALTRLSGVPVDITEVYNSYDKAVEYAATNPVAYEGQLIAVTEDGVTTVYVITPENFGTHSVTRTVGEGDEATEETVSFDIHIKEVGKKPVGDNGSITVDEDGIVALHKFDEAAAGKVPYVAVTTDEDGNEIKTIEWDTVQALAGNDANTVTEVAVPENSALSLNKVHNAETDTYTYTLDVTIPDVPVYTVTKDERAEGDTSTTYHLTKDNVNDGAEIVVPDAYDDTALAARVTAVESLLSGEDNADNHEDRLQKIEAFFEAADHDGEAGGLNDALDTLVEIQNYLDGEGDSTKGLLKSIKELDEAIGDASVPAKGEEGQEGYEEAKIATGLHALIEDVAGDAAKNAGDIAALNLQVADINSVAKSFLVKDEESGEVVEDAIKNAIADAKQAGTDAQSAIDALVQVADADKNIAAGRIVVAEETIASHEAALYGDGTEENIGLIAELEAVSGVANGAAAAFTSLTSENGDVTVAKRNISDIQEVIYSKDGQGTITSSIRDDVTALQNLTGSSNTTSGNAALHSRLSTVEGLVGHEGKPAQGNPGDEDYVAPVPGDGLLGDVEAVTATANAANALAVNHDTRIGKLEGDYVRIADNKLYGGKDGTDVIIFNCGSATENVEF